MAGPAIRWKSEQRWRGVVVVIKRKDGSGGGGDGDGREFGEDSGI